MSGWNQWGSPGWVSQTRTPIWGLWGAILPQAHSGTEPSSLGLGVHCSHSLMAATQGHCHVLVATALLVMLFLCLQTSNVRSNPSHTWKLSDFPICS